MKPCSASGARPCFSAIERTCWAYFSALKRSYPARICCSLRPWPSFRVFTYSMISSRSSRNLALLRRSPMSSSRVIFSFLGPLALKRSMSFMM